VQGNNYNNVGDALGAVNNSITNINNSLTNLGHSVSIIGAGLNSLSGRLDGIERRAMQGVAVAGAMVSAPMPSEPGKTRVKVNNIFYQGYGATAVSMAHRLHTNFPAALTAGVSFGYRNSMMVGAGAEVEF
jgi:autotransporter adhesin